MKKSERDSQMWEKKIVRKKSEMCPFLFWLNLYSLQETKKRKKRQLWLHISYFWLFSCICKFLIFVSFKLAIRFYFSELNVSLNSKEKVRIIRRKLKIVRLKVQNYLNFYSVAEISFHEKCIENSSSCWTSLEKQRCTRIKHPALQV